MSNLKINCSFDTNKLILLVLTCFYVTLFSCDSTANSKSQITQALTSPEAASRALLDVLRTRNEIDSWHCICTINGFSTIENRRLNYLEKWEIWLSNGQIKAVPVILEDDLSNWKKRYTDPATLCIGCYAKNTLVHYPSPELSADNTTKALSVFDEDAAYNHFLIIDPRKVGILPLQVGSELSTNQRNFYDFQSDQLNVREDVESDTVIVTAKMPGIAEISYSLAKSTGYLPIKIHRLNLYEKASVNQSSISYIEMDGVFLPEKVSTKKTIRDRSVFSEECKIETISLNEGFSDEIFSLKSLNIPEGTLVNWASSIIPPGDAGTLLYDGKKIVGRPSDGGEDDQIPYVSMTGGSNSSPLRLTLIIVNIFVVLILTGFLFQRYKKT